MTTDSPNFYVHPKAICDSERIGEKTKIWAFSHVMPGAVIGEDCNIGENVFVENQVIIGNRCTVKNGVSIWDHVVIEDDVFLGPNMVFTNDLRPRAFFRGNLYLPTPTRVCQGASIGANATIVCGVTIGQFALIGSGAVITKDVPAYAIVVGNPGRVIGQACICGQKLDENGFCVECNCNVSHNSIENAVEKRLNQRIE